MKTEVLKAKTVTNSRNDIFFRKRFAFLIGLGIFFFYRLVIGYFKLFKTKKNKR